MIVGRRGLLTVDLLRLLGFRSLTAERRLAFVRELEPVAMLMFLDTELY